jgi:hypothetical protein
LWILFQLTWCHFLAIFLRIHFVNNTFNMGWIGVRLQSILFQPLNHPRGLLPVPCLDSAWRGRFRFPPRCACCRPPVAGLHLVLRTHQGWSWYSQPFFQKEYTRPAGCIFCHIRYTHVVQPCLYYRTSVVPAEKPSPSKPADSLFLRF